MKCARNKNMIEEIQGDVFKAKETVLIHGCNCHKAMGAGVAKIIRELYPEAWLVDQQTLWGDKNKLGTYTSWTGKHYYYDQDITVVNLYSQYKYGHKEVYADYDAIRNGLEAVEFVFRSCSFAMPRIGTGLAGGDWATIKKIIEECFTGHRKNETVKIYYLSSLTEKTTSFRA
jgi:O-acetyl-ADP-ribose deacetylase (regulator of RNase III)